MLSLPTSTFPSPSSLHSPNDLHQPLPCYFDYDDGKGNILDPFLHPLNLQTIKRDVNRFGVENQMLRGFDTENSRDSTPEPSCQVLNLHRDFPNYSQQYSQTCIKHDPSSPISRKTESDCLESEDLKSYEHILSDQNVNGIVLGEDFSMHHHPVIANTSSPSPAATDLLIHQRNGSPRNTSDDKVSSNKRPSSKHPPSSSRLSPVQVPPHSPQYMSPHIVSHQSSSSIITIYDN